MLTIGLRRVPRVTAPLCHSCSSSPSRAISRVGISSASASLAKFKNGLWPSSSKQGGVTPTGELDLLGSSAGNSEQLNHELRTAPILTRDAWLATSSLAKPSQYGVFGSVLGIFEKSYEGLVNNPRLYVNTTAPFSALVCGVQGSGKSHTVSVLLENMLISKYPAIGTLEKPMTGLVLNFSDGGANSRPCEAAFVGRPAALGMNLNTPPVQTLLSSRFYYRELNKLDAEAFMSLMAVDSSQSAPLYMQTFLSLLRESQQKNYDVEQFQTRLKEETGRFTKGQAAGFAQRMSLLESFIDKDSREQCPKFHPGQLTIIDLSDPFIDAAAACGLFDIVTRLFIRERLGTGKILVVDEAHKYLSASRPTVGLSKTLSSLIRQQRHLGMRVIISTQEPTVVPETLLDLCNVAIVHRFSSPTWWEHLSKHVSANISSAEAFDKVVTLRTGEAIVIAPSGLHVMPKAYGSKPGVQNAVLGHLGRRHLLARTRKRITADGGASVMHSEL